MPAENNEAIQVITDMVIAELEGMDLPSNPDSAEEKLKAENLQRASDVAIIMEGGTPAYQEQHKSDITDLNSSIADAMGEVEYNKGNLDSSYFATAEEKRPASQQEMSSLNDFHGGKNTQQVRQVKTTSAQSNNTDKQSTATDVNKPMTFNTIDSTGKPIQVKMRQYYTPFRLTNNDLDRDNAPKNVNTIKKYITRLVYESVGGWERITSIQVKTGYLIVNNAMILPQSQGGLDVRKLPYDVADYLVGGNIAYLFNWNMLLHMSNLITLDIDTTDFYLAIILTDLGCGRSGGYMTIFYEVDSLQVFRLGDQIITADDVMQKINADEEAHLQQQELANKMAKEKRALNIFDGYTIDLYKGTNDFEKWSWGNLRTYAQNRGNKGIFRFSLGCISRFLIGTSSSVINAGVHLATGIGKVLKKAWIDGTTSLADGN